MDALMLDGNAVAGLLQQVFGGDLTTAIGTCGSCGASGPVGAMFLFQGAGGVLRCPHCHTALIKIVSDDTRVWIGFPGLRALQLATSA